ncbi:exo-alpha-sialidase [Sphingobacterium sp. SGG-5]|uniref:sialidase family protein n=1 Tax=Sphingobacterium sp. SGG-5 TaxID=2710881 RepID=UPI0013EE1A4A|nr:sialidase family protein [Sphingobacterium sp. SGG-5]NGM63578.1 exo-alpha-sialidase [Sphingobacterium sp. SGG-5]
MKVKCFLFVFIFSVITVHGNEGRASIPPDHPVICKIKDIIIYKDDKFFSTFPSIVKNGKNDYIVAFRRSPERILFGERYSHHVDPNSYLVAVRSRDGENWSTEPQLIYAHPYGGSQDPCVIKLKNGDILCASYGWAFVRPEGFDNLKKPYFKTIYGATFFGGFQLRSLDNGKSWGDLTSYPHVSSEIFNDVFGNPLSAYNRGAMYQSKNGRIFWSVAVNDTIPIPKTSNHLLVSDDNGATWQYSGVVAKDDKVAFNETSVYETPKGDIVAFMRTANFDDQACIARSTDGGKTFTWQSMGFKGHPCHALRLPDNRVLLTYGYRHKPEFGVRARILNPECTDFATAEEFVIRKDGGDGDVGYPWSVNLGHNRVLVTYYFNENNETRYIAGSILEISK